MPEYRQATHFHDDWTPKGETERAGRAVQIQEILRELLPDTVHSVLEIGPGTGTATTALRQVLSDVPLYVIDHDPRAQTHMERFNPVQILNEVPTEFAEFIHARSANLVLGFRLPGEVLLHVHQSLKQSSLDTPVTFIFSFIPTSELDIAPKVDNIAPRFPIQKNPGITVLKRFVLHEGRDYIEWGAAVQYGA